jgi:hypothetical protein
MVLAGRRCAWDGGVEGAESLRRWRVSVARVLTYDVCAVYAGCPRLRVLWERDDVDRV